MPFGSEVALSPEFNAIERLYIRLFGVPILGLRVRARTILGFLDQVGAPQRIADGGSGRGLMALACARRFAPAEVIGVDLNAKQMDNNNVLAQRLGMDNLRYEARDVLTLPELGRFDLILSCDNLEHLEDDLGCARTFHNALNPGGYLLVHVPHITRNLFGRHSPNWMDVEGHVRPGYSKEDLTNLLQQAGLRVESCVYNYNSLETLANNLSKAITGAKEKNKGLYALLFPLLLGIAWLGSWYRPRNDGSGLVALAVREA